MSGLLVTAVLESALPRELKPIAMALASFADDDGNGVRPSRARLAWGLDMTERHAQRVIGRLVAMGILERLERARPGRATVCRFVAAKLPRRPAFSPRQRALPIERRTARTRDAGVSHSGSSTAADILLKSAAAPPPPPDEWETSTHRNGGHLCADEGHPCVRDPSRETPGRRTTAAENAAAPVAHRSPAHPAPPLAPPPGFAQVVQIARSVRIPGLPDWTEDTKAAHLAQGFRYDTSAIRRAQAAIEHVDPPVLEPRPVVVPMRAAVAVSPGNEPDPVAARRVLEQLRATVLSRPGHPPRRRRRREA